MFYSGIELTNKCNLGCKWCYDNSHGEDSREISFEEVKECIRNLKELGTEILNLTGREATIRDDLLEIIKYAKELGLKVILTTNGFSLLKKYKEALQYLDYLSIPLDASKPELANLIRCSSNGEPSNHFERIMNILDYLKDNEFDFKLKINTLVEKRNLNDVSLIGRVIFCDIWKIVEVQKQGDAIKNWKEISITNEQYSKVVNNILDMQKKGEYPNVRNILVKDYDENSKEIYPLPIINAFGELYFPAEENINTGIKVGDKDFVKKTQEFLEKHKNFNKRNINLFKEHYGEE